MDWLLEIKSNLPWRSPADAFTLVLVAHGNRFSVSGCAPFVPVMETADLWDSYDPSKLWRLHSPRFRRVLTQ